MRPIKYAYYITYKIAGHLHLRSEDFHLDAPIRGRDDLNRVYRHIANVIFHGSVDPSDIAILNLLPLPGDDVYPEQAEDPEPTGPGETSPLWKVAHEAYMANGGWGIERWSGLTPNLTRAWAAAAEAVRAEAVSTAIGTIQHLESRLESALRQLEEHGVEETWRP